MVTNYKDITIILVSYKSNFEIEKILRKINQDVKILIVENSNDKKVKNYFEQRYKNISVILNVKNTGQSGGINTGLKNVRTKYCIYMDMDINFELNVIDRFYKIAEKINDFALLVPPHNKSKYPKSFDHHDQNISLSGLKRMKIVHGYFMFFKMSAVKDVGYYDENIFFYFDETDYCLRITNKNHKIYIVEDVIVHHKEGGSYNDKIPNYDIEYLRQWHYMWGKFYFHKKHYGYLKAFSATFFDLIEGLIKIPILFFYNKNKYLIYLNRLKGLFNSMIGRKSWKRL